MSVSMVGGKRAPHFVWLLDTYGSILHGRTCRFFAWIMYFGMANDGVFEVILGQYAGGFLDCVMHGGKWFVQMADFDAVDN